MVLRLEHVFHRFGKQLVLDDVSLTIEAGDCYGFIGHNGAGKTTAMRVLLGLLKPDSGRVIIDGFDTTQYVREARARMGALIEQSGFHPHWSGARNLALLDRLAGGSSDIAALIEQVGLTHAGNKPVRAYSQGMRQRLGVAQALLGDPAYVLLDEPSNGLDPDGIQEMRELIRHLTQDQGRTVLISSHQLHELSGICNRVGVLRSGRLVMEETIENLLRTDVYRLNGTEEVELAGRDPATVLAEMVSSGKRVESFAPKSPSLEEIYHRDSAPIDAGEPVAVSAPAERRAKARALPRMFSHEFTRWAGRLSVPFALLIPAIAAAITIFLRKAGIEEDRSAVDSQQLFSTTSVNSFEGVALGLKTGVWLLGYILMGFASQSVVAEYAQGTLRNVLLRPLTRLQVCMGKWLAVMAVSFAAYFCLVGVSVAVASWAFEWKGVVEILANGMEYPHRELDELWPKFWLAIVSPIRPLLTMAGIGFLVGCIFCRSAAALAVGFGVGALLETARGFVINTELELWLPTTYLPSPLARTSYIDYFVQFAQGIDTKPVLDTVFHISPLCWIVATTFTSAWILKRRYVP